VIRHSSISTSDGTTVLTLVGDLDMAIGDELRALVRQAIGNPLTRHVIVDLADVTFADSTAIGALLQLRAGCQDVNITFALRSPSRQFIRLLALTGLSEVFGLGNPLAS
jgi:anti-sigma B factor antagonist